jgi:tetratricopeptide (TPR) repeat protein
MWCDALAESPVFPDSVPWRVFVSHTSELRDYPGGMSYVGAVERAISAAGHVIVDMAGFPASAQAPAQVCAGRVRGCDVYVGVLGTRYGSPVRDKPEVSYTELEFDTATQAGLDRLVFLLDEDAADVGIPLSSLIDRQFGARQDAFRRRVRAGDLITQSFASPAELGQLVERSLRDLADARRRIAGGIRREQTPAGPRPVRASKFVNPPPAVAPVWFQDRQVETGLLARYVTDPGIRLVSVTGRGGIGKTAMVCRLLEGLESGLIPDVEGDAAAVTVGGIVYLSRNGMHKVEYPTLVADLLRLLPPAVTQRLQPLYLDYSPAEMMLAVLEAFPAGEPPVVVLLDNLESVIDAEHETLAERALHEALSTVLNAPAHAVTIIATTRIMPAELVTVEPGRQRQLRLDAGLGSPDAQIVLRALDDDGRLGLRDAPDDLLDGLRRHTRGFPRALEAVKAILDGDHTLTPHDLLDRTRQLPEDQVVQALVGEAYELLDGPARQVMQALAVYPAPVSAVGVEFLLRPVNPTIDAAPILTRLVRRQLVRFQDRRYFQHPLDRQYARSRLPAGSPGDSPAAFTLTGLRARAADYYAQIRTPPESWRSLEDVRPQLAEFELRCDTRDYDTAAAVLADIDMDYLLVWGHYRTLAELNQRVHQRITDPFLNGRHLVRLAIVHSRLGNYRQAIDLHTQVLAEVREAGHREYEIGQLCNLGFCHSSLGEYRQAIDLHTQALAIARDTANREAENASLGNLGYCHSSLGDYRQAIDLHTQALAIARDTGNREAESASLAALGRCYADLGDNRQAIDLHTQALAIARDTGDRRGESNHLSGLGFLYASLGDYRQAIDLHTQALAIARDTGNRQHEAGQLGNLATCYVFSGDYRQAIDLRTQLLAIARDTGDRQHEAGELSSLASCHMFLGEYRQAIDLHTQALAIARDIGDRQHEAGELSSLASCHMYLGEYRQAIDLHTQALAIARDTGDRRLEGHQLSTLGLCHVYRGDYHQATDLHTQALAIARDTGDRRQEGHQLGALGLCYFSLGDYGQAISLHSQALAIARDTGDRQQEGHQLGRLALCHVFLGNYRQATDLQAQMLASGSDTSDRQYQVGQLGNVATCHVILGDYRQALDLYTQALAIAREIGAMESVVNSQPGLARAHLQLGDPATALTVLAEHHGSSPGAEPAIRVVEAMALLELHRTEEAVKAFRDALAAADAHLALADTNVAALQVRALALSGLAVTTSDPARTAETETALGRAQAVANAPGAVADTRRLLKLIASHDHSGILAEAASLQDQ